MHDTITLSGDVQVLLNNEVVLEKKNLVVTAGKGYLASALIAAPASPFVSMAIGTGTTAATVADTALQTETARAVFTSSSVASNVATLSTTFIAGSGTGAITEAGIFTNASSGGTMLSHVVFSAVNKGSTDTLTINWTITVS
jgi:hypothetical protein